MPTQTINISLPKDLVEKIDQAAKAEYASRSDYIRQALVGKLKADKLAEQDWLLLESLMEDAGAGAERNGYITDQDFVRAVKEVRQKPTPNASLR